MCARTRARNWHMLAVHDCQLEPSAHWYRCKFAAGGVDLLKQDSWRRPCGVGRLGTSSSRTPLGSWTGLGAQEFEGPVLGPLHKFLALHPRTCVRQVFSYVVLVVRCFSDQILVWKPVYSDTVLEHPHVASLCSCSGKWDSDCPRQVVPEVPPHRLDRSSGLGLSRSSTLVISTLAVLVALETNYGDVSRPHQTSVTIALSWTDKRANSAALTHQVGDGSVASARCRAPFQRP